MVTKLERADNTVFYLHNAWANSPDGTAGFTLEESEDAAYIGNCISMSSAEVLNPSSYNWIAVEFEAVEESDTAELTELGEDVPEDPEDEDDDYSYDDYMDGAIQSAADTATTAQESADIAQQKAEEATASAAEAKTAADTAREKAEAATTDAATAKQKAEEATSSAALAQQKAESATAAAGAAHTAAESATSDARAAGIAAATAKQKAEEATSSAALAQQKAESATAAAGAAHTAAESATSDARAAGIAAATAQAAAEAAQGDINDQKKYFYHDKLGAHVLDSAGGKFRTDVKSSGLYIVDTLTEKTAAFFGANNCRIGGGEDSNNIQISKSGVKINNGVFPIVDISIDKSGQKVFSESLSFPGEKAWEVIRAGNVWSENYELKEEPTSIISVILSGANPFGPAPVDLRLEYNALLYGYRINGNKLIIWADGSAGETLSYEWENYTEIEIIYSCEDVSGTMKLDNIDLRNNIDMGISSEIIYIDGGGHKVGLTAVTRGTGTATATTGRVSIQPNWWRCGNLVQMELRVAATAAVNPGKNIATGTITGIPRPVTTFGLRAVSYYGDNANVSFVSQNGDFTVRNCGNDALAKGNDAIGIFTYITDGKIIGGSGSNTGAQPGGGA